MFTYDSLKDNPKYIILKRIESISQDELKKQAEGLPPFLFDEKQTELLIHAKKVVPIKTS